MRGLRLRSRKACASLILSCIVWGAAHLSAEAQPRARAAIATLYTSGPYVSVNGRPAANGMTIWSGDHVTTGPASSARIDLYSGGLVQLDANTDPDIFGAVTDYLGCWVRVLTGQLYSEGEGQTICFSSGAERIIAHSAFNLMVSPGRETLTVVAGQVSVAAAQSVTASTGTQVSVAGGSIVSRRSVSPAELARITAWRRRYAFFSPRSPSPLPQPYPPPARRFYPIPNPLFPEPGSDGGRRHRPPAGDGYSPPPLRRGSSAPPSPPPNTEPYLR